jgi:flagellar biogenesis protein FliO
MVTTILGAIAVILFAVYLVRRRSRLRAEEDNF